MTQLGRLALALLLPPLLVGALVCTASTASWAQEAPSDAEAPVDLAPEEVPVDLAPEEIPGEETNSYGVETEETNSYGVETSQLTALLNEGLELLEDDRYLDASLRFNDIVNNGDDVLPVVQEAQFALAVSLFELNLHQSSLLQFEAIVDRGPSHTKYRETVPYLLHISRQTVGDENIRARIAQFPPEFYPAEFSDELHFLVGQYFYASGSYDDALVRFQLVSEKNGDFFARARYLEGVIHVQASGLADDPEAADSSRLAEAAKALKSVLRFRRDNGSSETIDKVAAMANLALGRLFFSTRQYQVAVRYYDRVAEDDPNWLQSMFEVSWVYFQLKKYGRSLGNLHTLNSPFFSDQYFPESRVLQALILFYNCRYDEANVVIKTFVQDYYPLMTELRDEVNRIADPNAFYAWLALLSRAGKTDFSARFKRIFNAALADRRLRRKFVFVKALNDELETLKEITNTNPVAGPFLEALRGELKAYRSLVVGEAGGLAQARLLRVLKELKQHLAGALKIKGETLKAQRGVLAETVRAEQAAALSARTEYTVDAEHIEWPFSGEYWRDELGSYIYDISSSCAVRARPE
jgi:tetratricopeptide (TPR) repeat protein